MIMAALHGGGAVAAAVAAVGGAAGDGDVVVGHVEVRLGFDDCFVYLFAQVSSHACDIELGFWDKGE